MQFEKKERPFSVKIDGVHIWERIRHKVKMVIDSLLQDAPPVYKKSWSPTNLWKVVPRYFWNSISNGFFRAESCRALFVGHQRRKLEEDGKWWDVYCDPIYESCEIDSAHFEFPYRTRHRSPSKTSEVKYLDAIRIAKNIPLLGNPSLSSHDINTISRWGDSLEKIFSVDVGLKELVVSTLKERSATMWLYRILIRRLNPSLVVLTVSYGKENLIEVCKSHKIPVVELQHGYIGENHLGYSLPPGERKIMFPDYMLTFGKYWQDGVNFPIPEERLMPVGFPYLEMKKNRYKEKSSVKKNMTFISQPNSGVQLSKLASQAADSPHIQENIVYKLHPHEYDNWKNRYPWLANSRATVVDADQPHLYEIFAQSTVQVGVNSTALYEGLAFGLPTLLYDASDAKCSHDLIEVWEGSLVHNIDDIIAATKKMTKQLNNSVSNIFERNSNKHMCRALHKLSNEGTTYDELLQACDSTVHDKS